ncbi:MAG: esterase [Ideonella sp.]|jgi:predicted esterase YcpF (UPF0227 family)|nr:esterase [Ideonella sp.]
MAPVSHLLYLHGFRSSPQSFKARMTGAWIAAHRPGVTWWCPQLPPSPAEAIALVRERLASWQVALGGAGAAGAADAIGVIGSSLGGFYATVVAEAIGCRSVVLNPAVEPARDLASWIGEVQAWHSDERFHFTAADVQALDAMRPPAITRPDRTLAVIAKGDELLDWREMAARYAACQIVLLEGGDHALSDFERHLPRVLGFLGLTS